MQHEIRGNHVAKYHIGDNYQYINISFIVFWLHMFYYEQEYLQQKNSN